MCVRMRMCKCVCLDGASDFDMCEFVHVCASICVAMWMMVCVSTGDDVFLSGYWCVVHVLGSGPCCCGWSGVWYRGTTGIEWGCEVG